MPTSRVLLKRCSDSGPHDPLGSEPTARRAGHFSGVEQLGPRLLRGSHAGNLREATLRETERRHSLRPAAVGLLLARRTAIRRCRLGAALLRELQRVADETLVMAAGLPL